MDFIRTKKIEAPFIPPFNEQNYDKRYCEGQDNVGETTIERYELYLQSDLYVGVFAKYTFVNMNYISQYEKNDKKQKFRINSSNNSHNNKIILNKNKNNKNNLNQNNIVNNNSGNNNINNLNNNLPNGKIKEIKNYSNRGINSAVIRNSSNSQKNLKNNNAIININLGVNNKQNFNTIDKSMTKKEKNYMSNIDNFSINNIAKYNTPMVNENIMCNNYINLNFNNVSNFNNEKSGNKRNEQEIDVSALKKIISNNINDLKQKMKKSGSKVNNNFNRNINYMKNRNEKNNINTNKKKERISVNKLTSSKYTLYKSSSMKSMGGYNNNNNKNNYLNNYDNKSPVLIKSNNNNKATTINKNNNKRNKKQNIKLNKEKASLSINSTNLNSKKELNINFNNFNTNNKKNPINYLSASNYGNHKTINANVNYNHNHHIFSRGKSEYNLKIETNDMNFLSLYNQRHNKTKAREKSFTKTASCDRIFMGSATSHHHNQMKNKTNKKLLQKVRIKSNINFDKKLVSWIHKNFKNAKNKKVNYNNSNNYSKSKNTEINGNKIKYTRHDSLLNINNSNYNYNNNNGNIKNKNFPSISSINLNKSPYKKIIELNDINPNSRKIKSNRSNFNTINLMTSITKVKSTKNIYDKKRISKFQKMLSQKQTFSPFSSRQRKSKMSKKNSAKNIFNSEYNFEINYNYKPRNLKIESTSNGFESKNRNKFSQDNFEYIKSI